MGKFYLENKHLWFRHQTERARQKRLGEENLFGRASVELVEELRFVCSEEGYKPTYVRLIDFGDELVTVESSNIPIGHLDEASSAAIRKYFEQHPILANICPAVAVEYDQWSGTYLLHLGCKKY